VPLGYEGVSPRPCVVVTRPQDQADPWVSALSARGWPTLALPLVAITDPMNDQGLRHWRAHWPQVDAVMVVSAAAVRAFVNGPAAMGAGQAATRWWAPGPATALALSQALPRWGVALDRIDQPVAHAEQFDSESLWAQVATQVSPGDEVLVVAGGNGRDWLAERCSERGAQVHRCTAYARQVPTQTPQWLEALAQAQRQGQIWMFSSAQALEHLKACTLGHDWSRTTALATHPRIAQSAQTMGFGRVWVCRSSLDDAIQTLESKQHDR